ncbi:MAG: sterol desaturase family protein [Magnetospiraceae bacterium]
MENFLLDHEGAVRLSLFLGIFAAVALAEIAAPRRKLQTSKRHRWITNLGIVVLNTALLRLIILAAAVEMAHRAETAGWGLFNLVDLPRWLEVLLSIILLDLVIYLQHVLVHAVPGLWRLHMVHHSDMDYDVTTGARFHPVEIFLSMGIKIAAVTTLGAPAVAVILFEVLLNGTAMFNHGNLKLPASVDRVLRCFVVTPDMHRVHHSNIPDETNSNYGFNLPWWDRLFGTYRAQPTGGHTGMTIGLDEYRDPSALHLHHLLLLPLTGREGHYPINRRGDDA